MDYEYVVIHRLVRIIRFAKPMKTKEKADPTKGKKNKK